MNKDSEQVYCDWSLPYSELLIRAKLTALQDIAIFMYKVKNNLVTQYVAELFSALPAKYNLRNSDVLYLEQELQLIVNTQLDSSGLIYAGSKLKSNIRNAIPISSFKNIIRKTDISVLIDTEQCVDCKICYL